ncbi:MAG TPA: FHA domain-containing protein [Burkholderiales bacterium]|nr:FHA domain-containing protein [Burkholderiales bacterium]
MAKLILSLDGQVIKEFTLSKERTTIGRKPHNDIQIDNLAVSGEHAMIMTILNDSFLEDLGSTNGTLVNGQPIKKHFLQNNDVIEIGKYKIKYVSEAPSNLTQEDFEKTMVLRAPAAVAPPKIERNPTDTQTNLQAATNVGDTSISAQPAAAPAAPAPAAAQIGMASNPPGTPKPAAPAPAAAQVGMTTIPPVAPKPAAAPAQPAVAPPVSATVGAQGMIQILSGPNAGKELPLAKPLTTLGKPGVQVAVIAKRPQGYFITHVEGANFPVVNGKTLDAQAHQLSDHDIIELAGVKMEFFLKA